MGIHEREPHPEGPVAPVYNKPDTPGVWMNFDNTVSLYYVVEPDETFEEAAQGIFLLLKEAQERFPDWPRVLYLDVHGHTGPYGGFDGDFFEFQQEFLLAALGPFFTALDLPLTGGLLNPSAQRNDVPDRLNIAGPSTR